MFWLRYIWHMKVLRHKRSAYVASGRSFYISCRCGKRFEWRL